MMDNYQESTCLDLEKALADESVAPINLPFLFLKAITQDFSDNQRIGSGGFGSVYKGTLRNGKVAVKRLHNKIEVHEDDFQREVSCLVEVNHKNIVRFLGYCCETQRIRELYQGRYVWADERHMLFCFEFLSKGSLANYLTGPPSGLQWGLRYQIIKGVCEGIGYLHQQRITHMDLKPDNILLDDSMVPKIADFGLSRRFSGNQSKIVTENIVGSKGYMAPEFLRSGTITLKTDIYSLGVIIIQILMGCMECPTVDKVLESWTNTFGTSKSSPLQKQVKLCAEIGIDCMHDDPSRRPDIQDIISRLNETDISEKAGGSRFHRYYRWAKQECKQMKITVSMEPEVISRVCFQDIRAIDVHSTQPWILVGHGDFLSIWYYEIEEINRAGNLYAHVTSVRFIPRKEWCVAGDDRGYIHVYSCLSRDKIKSFKATSGGSVRSFAIHPTWPYLLSACQDQGVIEIWDWEKGWACSRKVQTGSNLACATFNPTDASTFVTSHFGLIKVWPINYSGHQGITKIICPSLTYQHDHVFTEAAGRNHVVLTISTDPQIWDLQTGTRVHTLSKPRFCIAAVACHPTLPLIALGGDDDNHARTAVCFWNSTNYRLERTVWRSYKIRYLGFVGSRRLVIGSEDGIEVLEIDMKSLASQQ